MRLSTFIYTASNLILFQLISLETELVDRFIDFFCVIGILSLGIAHGSIDNFLFGAKPGKSTRLFILHYLIVIAAYALLWLLLPSLSFSIFLLVSAYHFGQSQFVAYSIKSNWLAKIIFMSWGSLIILLSFHFNQSELLGYQVEFDIFPSFILSLFDYTLVGIYITLPISLLGLFFIKTKGWISTSNLFKELYLLALMAFSFKMFPVLVGFSLYFVWLHSFDVMLQEYQYCKKRLNVQSIVQFVKLFLPLTVVSIVGLIMIVIVLFYCGLINWLPYTLIIALSCITLPHSFVMEKFYQPFSPKA